MTKWNRANLPNCVINITERQNYDEAHLDSFIDGANSVFAKGGDDAEAIAAGISQASEITNASTMPKVYYCRHLEPGFVKHKAERYKITAEAMKKMMPTFAGKPVFVGHQQVPVDHIENQADGYVADCFYNPLDGWCWSKFIATSDAAHDAIAKGYKVSNAFVPTETKGGGRDHDIDYTKELVNARYTHLAIVPVPKYDEAMILTPEGFKSYNDARSKELTELQNSKEKGKMSIKKIFKNSRTEVTNSAEIDDTCELELASGKTISIGDMVKIVEEKELQNAADAAKKVKDAANTGVDLKKTVKVNGKDITIEELMNKAEEIEKENSESEADKAAKADQKVKDDAKAAADAKKKTEKEEEELKNSSNFKNLDKAGANKKAVKIHTTSDGVQRGSSKYGSNNKTKE